MDLIWAAGHATAESLTHALGGELTNASVRTLLRRMERKGFLTHHTEGREFVYAPVIDRAAAGRSALTRVVQHFYRGSVEQLLLGLVEHRMVNRRVLDRLAKKVAEAEAGRSAPASRKRR